MNGSKRPLLLLILIALAGLGLRLALTLTSQRTLGGDEAVFGLMAKHILTRHDFPIYCWRLQYSSALVSYLGAAAFQLFGMSGIVLRLTTLPWAVLSIVAAYYLGRKGWGPRGGILAALFACVPPLYVSSHTILPVGGYPEVQCFGPLVLLLALRLADEPPEAKSALLWSAGFGFLCGFTLWASHLALPYVAAAGIFLILTRRRIFRPTNAAAMVAASAVGGAPILIYNLTQHFGSFMKLGGMALHAGRKTLAGGPPLEVIGRQAIDRIESFPSTLAGLLDNAISVLGGANYDGSATLGLLGVPLLVAYSFPLFSILRRPAARPAGPAGRVPLLLILVAATTLAYYLAVDLWRARHIMPLYTALSLLLAGAAAESWRRGKKGPTLLCSLLLTVNLVENGMDMRTLHEDFDPLLRRLEERRIEYAYSDYMTAYPLIFYSNERILVSPTLRGGDFNDRKPEYTLQVRSAPGAAYIFNGEKDTGRFEATLRGMNETYLKEIVPPFILYHGFSRNILPEEIGLTF